MSILNSENLYVGQVVYCCKFHINDMGIKSIIKPAQGMLLGSSVSPVVTTFVPFVKGSKELDWGNANVITDCIFALTLEESVSAYNNAINSYILKYEDELRNLKDSRIKLYPEGFHGL